MIRKIFIVGFLIFSCFAFAQQQYPSVYNLRGTPQNNGTVLIEFTISESIFTYSSYDLQRSGDSAFNFASVQYYSAAVGGATAQDYSYYDPVPDPTKKYYYKIVFPNGAQSNVLVVDVGNVFGHYKIVKHPIEDDGNSRLEFTYIQGTTWLLEIADPKGYFLYRIGGITQNSIPLNASWFNGTGIYFFRLYPYDGSTVIQGRFVVIKPAG
ncbi:MAG TPA: hypothetical protein VGF30_05310 [Bacteroidia bacterium]